MPSAPLQAFKPPSGFFEFADLGISEGSIVKWVLLAAFALWAVYTLVVMYHWIKYSHASSVAFPAIGVHLAVSLAIMAYALTGTLPV